MDILLQKSALNLNAKVLISGSKSESNRLLILRALFPELHVINCADADDSKLMIDGLQSQQNTINIHHAGTAMRFLTSYFAMAEDQQIILTGSNRMQQRPIAILVDALRQLGAKIDYMEVPGFPPLKITGKKLAGGTVELDAGISSQYITSLLLIGAKLENGLTIILKGNVTSRPYIQMTVDMLNEVGISTVFAGQKITVKSTQAISQISIIVESDWSSASYFYSIIALSKPGTQIRLFRFKPDSKQGDSALAQIYEAFGVQTDFNENALVLTKLERQPGNCVLDLQNTPDIAQTIAVTCFGLGIACRLTGLHTLKIKETDRLTALKQELEKLGAVVTITSDSLELQSGNVVRPNVTIETYNDHRMAMAFAPLATKTGIIIKEAEVVSKSYPSFWTDLENIGIQVSVL